MFYNNQYQVYPGYGQQQYPQMPQYNNFQASPMQYQVPLQYQQNPFAYRHQNWNAYQFNTYAFSQQQIDAFAQQIFFQFDYDRSGNLSLQELYPAICTFCNLIGLSGISYDDVAYCSYMFDMDQNGLINFFEFQMILQALGGLSRFDQMTYLTDKRNRLGNFNFAPSNMIF